MIVISNTTPFISLCSVDLLSLLPSIFGEVHVAPSVVDECSEGGRIFVPDLASLPWVKVQSVENEMQLPALFELDRGERDTLLLAALQSEALVIMDEKLGRNMAEYMGLQVTGTLGEQHLACASREFIFTKDLSAESRLGLVSLIDQN